MPASGLRSLTGVPSIWSFTSGASFSGARSPTREPLTYKFWIGAFANGPKSATGVFAMPTETSGAPFSAAELAAFIGGIKTELANFAASRSSSKPNLVLPVRLRAAGQSGLMWVPLSLGKILSAPIIAYQHGTEVYWKCAPSRYDPNPLSVLASPDVTGAFLNYMECTTAALMASAGYIVVMADYPGFGDSRASHPYVTLSLGDSVLTMLGAAMSALSSPFASAHPNGKIFLIGYSEGGFVTMAAAKTLQEHALPVTAAVPCCVA